MGHHVALLSTVNQRTPPIQCGRQGLPSVTAPLGGPSTIEAAGLLGRLINRIRPQSFRSNAINPTARQGSVGNPLMGGLPMVSLNPDVDDAAPSGDLTDYDVEHIITYLRMLDANTAGADWRDVARIVLHIEPLTERERARKAYRSHLARAQWMTEHGWRQLLLSA